MRITSAVDVLDGRYFRAKEASRTVKDRFNVGEGASMKPECGELTVVPPSGISLTPHRAAALQ